MKNLLLQKFHQVLEHIAVNGSATLNELAEKLDIPLPTLSRLVSDMVEMQLLEKLDYYRIAPAPGLIRLGECSKKHSFLLRNAVPKLREFSEKKRMNSIFAGFDGQNIFELFSTCLPENHPVSVWESGLAPVIMTAAGISDGECLRQFRQNTPRCSEADVLIFERELEHIRNARQLFRTTSMRYWSCAIPFNYREMCCGICFYGSAPENCSREKFDLECSLLVSRIAAAVSEE